MFSGFFFSKLFYKQSTFVLKEQMFVGDALHSFSQHSPRYAAMGCGGWEGNFLITASSKDKTYCHDNMIYYIAFKNKNLLSKSSKPTVMIT